MDHSELREKCRKAFGHTIPIAARERWAIFIKEERTEFTFRYEWIRDPRFYDWVRANQKDLDIRDGAEWFGVYICKPDGEPINQYGTV
jgi:hypothetical protein